MPITSFVASTAIAATAVSATVPVIRTDPIVENRPVMVKEYRCNQTSRPTYDQNNAIVGGIIGGIIGSQMGHDSSSRRVMTGVGAVVGSQIGGVGPSVPITHCGDSYTQRAVPTVVAYRVYYVVDGIQQSAILNYDPGSHITVERNYTIR